MRASLKPTNSLSVVIFFLKSFGIWHFDNRFQPLYYVYGKMMYLMVSVFFSYFQFMYIVKVWGNLPAMADGIYLMITIMLIAFKVGTLNLKQVKQTIYLQNNKLFTSHKIEQDYCLEKSMYITKRNSIVILSLCTATCFSWASDPIITGESKNKKLPVNAWYPIPYNKSPYYEYTYVYQWVGEYN